MESEASHGGNREQMKRFFRRVSACVLIVLVVRLSLAAAPAAPTTKPAAEGIEYFEKNIWRYWWSGVIGVIRRMRRR
jgi:hypothetical protein